MKRIILCAIIVVATGFSSALLGVHAAPSHGAATVRVYKAPT